MSILSKMPTEHILKLWPIYYDAVVKGFKTFEVRENHDRCFQKGDTVILQEYDPTPLEAPVSPMHPTKVKGYTGSKDLAFRIGYVMPIDANRVVFSLVELPKLKVP